MHLPENEKQNGFYRQTGVRWGWEQNRWGVETVRRERVGWRDGWNFGGGTFVGVVWNPSAVDISWHL